ncbi:hypothetical protein CTheo_8228 [Ceratobasidium theobromae]|uniref:Uncharacterized protein n=1 Tax=Ceratobasidium theobromae TaxID=1582974 RepID=A0A5N5QA01_9AGAM|nr:hypothetical protein CTheo_8228 [Ceratobasidium theobromae]
MSKFLFRPEFFMVLKRHGHDVAPEDGILSSLGENIVFSSSGRVTRSRFLKAVMSEHASRSQHEPPKCATPPGDPINPYEIRGAGEAEYGII